MLCGGVSVVCLYVCTYIYRVQTTPLLDRLPLDVDSVFKCVAHTAVLQILIQLFVSEGEYVNGKCV